MFIGITLKIKRLDGSFLAETGVKLLSSRQFGSCSGYCWPFSEQKSKRKDLFTPGEHGGDGLLRTKYLKRYFTAERSKSAAFPCCKSQFYAIPEVPAQESPFYRAWHNRPKEGTLWSYLCYSPNNVSL